MSPGTDRAGGTAGDDGAVYLDHAAATPMYPEVVRAMAERQGAGWANPSGAHRWARAERRVLDGARAELADILGVAPGDVVFCSGGTEADNLALRGAGLGGQVVVSAIEHHAVLEPARTRHAVTVGVDRCGRLDMAALRAALSPEVSLVSVMLVNNEVGTVQDLAAVKSLMRRHAPNAVLHTDAVQALGWLDLRSAAAAADLISVSAHKIGGPRGIGLLACRSGVTVSPQITGGGQERDRRAGTQDVAGAVGFALAATITDERRDAARSLAIGLADRLIRRIHAEADDVVVTAADGDDRSHLAAPIVHLSIGGVDPESLIFVLESEGVMASAASSCASGAQQASHVLAAMGVAPERAPLRLSLGHTTTEAEVDRAATAVGAAIRRLRSFPTRVAG